MANTKDLIGIAEQAAFWVLKWKCSASVSIVIHLSSVFIVFSGRLAPAQTQLWPFYGGWREKPSSPNLECDSKL